MHTKIMLEATILLIPVIEEPHFDMPIYIFYDQRYPAIGTNWVKIHMLWSNLQREMLLRGFKGKIELVSAKKLEDLMSNKERVVIIIASGALPTNIFSRDKDLVTPWLHSGGILLWFGYPLGYYTVYEGQVENETFWALPQHLLDEGIKRIGLGNFIQINPYPSNGTLETGTDSSSFPLSSLLDINYNIIQYGLLADNVSQDGLVLGKIGGTPLKCSISLVPVGMGKIVVFGFFVFGSYVLNGPEFSARDIAQLLSSGVIYTNKDLMPVCKRHLLLAGESLNNKVEFLVNSSIKGIVVYVYPTITSNSFLYHTEYIPNL
jgi:hypothetical protein